MSSSHWQLTGGTAERYEQVLVPAILGPAAAALMERAAPHPGDIVLDVGCGTGAAARLAAERTGPSGRIIGVDVNEEVIEVARSLPPVGSTAIEWHVGSADRLPLADRQVDLVLSAQAVQFLPDRPAALAEMRRVLKRGGRIGLSSWDALPASPYFQALVEAVSRHLGDDVVAKLRAAFGLSDVGEIRSLLEEAGFARIEMTIASPALDLPPPDVFVPAHVRATPMAGSFDAALAEARAAVARDVAEALTPYRTANGTRVPFTTHIAVAIA